MAWADIEPGTGMLAIGCARAENHLCEQIPGCNYGKDEIWRAPLSWASYVIFREVWARQPFEESPALAAWAASAWEDIQLAYGLRSRLAATPEISAEIDAIEAACNHVRASEGKTPLHLFPAQRGAVAWLVLMGRAIFGDPRGNGKTPPVIRAIQVMARRGMNVFPVLWTARPAAVLNVRDQIADWAPELRVQPVTGTALKRREKLETEADIYVMPWPDLRLHTRLASYPGQRFIRCTEHGGIDSGITASRCEVHPKELNARKFPLVVCDEAHAMQDARSKQTRAAWWMASQADWFWPVTGTITGDTIRELWPILHALDEKSAPAIGRWLKLFAIQEYAWNAGTEILGLNPQHENAFHAVTQPYIRRIPKEIAREGMPKQLPPVFRYPELTPTQKGQYRQLKKELLAEVSGQLLVPANSLVKAGRLFQLAGASLEITEGETRDGFAAQDVRLAMPSNKVSDLAEFLADNPGQLVVYANSPSLIELAERKLAELKISYCHITGGMTPEAMNQAEQWFQRGDVRVIFINEAGSESITLTAASTIFFMQPNPSFRGRDQAIGRVDRVSQVNPVRVVHSISPGTVDERMYALGCQKEERHQQVARDADLLRWIMGEDEPAAQAALPFEAS